MTLPPVLAIDGPAAAEENRGGKSHRRFTRLLVIFSIPSALPRALTWKALDVGIALTMSSVSSDLP